MLKTWSSGIYFFRLFPVCFLYKVLFFEPQLYYGTLHWIQTQRHCSEDELINSSGLASRAFWSFTAWIWRDNNLLCLCSHCLAQSNSTFDINLNYVEYSWISQSQKFGIFLLLITFLIFGRAVVAKLGYSWNF